MSRGTSRETVAILSADVSTPSPLYYLPVCVCSSSLLIHHVADSMQDSTLGVFPPTVCTLGGNADRDQGVPHLVVATRWYHSPLPPEETRCC